jgi:hypothetical protein
MKLGKVISTPRAISTEGPHCRVKKTVAGRRCDIANENCQNLAWIGQNDIRVHLQIRFATVPDENKLSFWEVPHNFL